MLDQIKNFLSLDNAKSLGESAIDSVSRGYESTVNFFNRSNSNADNDPNSITVNSGEILTFPLDNNRNEYFSIQFGKYTRPSNFAPSQINTELNVFLPIPRILYEQHSLDISPMETRTIGATVGAINDYTQNYSNPERQEAGVIDFAGAGASFAKDLVGSKIPGGEAMWGIGEQAAGMIPNPHISIFFNGIQARPAFEFSWVFTPKNPAESEELKKILKKIKAKAIPSIRGATGNVMDYPYMVQISIEGLDEDMVPKFKKGLIQAININYTPNGPSFFKGTNSPTFIAFSFLMQEIEIFTSKDFKDKEQIQSKEPTATIEQTKKNPNAVPGATPRPRTGGGAITGTGSQVGRQVQRR